MYCSKCGTQNIDAARFCRECGTPLKNTSTTENSAEGTSFATYPQSNISVPNANYKASRRKELEKQKTNKMIWGIVWLFPFFPVSVYYFHKMYQISQEISKLPYDKGLLKSRI